VNLSALTDHEAAAMSGVKHGAVLITFAEAMVKDDDQVLAQSRQAVIKTMSPEAMVDAAGWYRTSNAWCASPTRPVSH
jgi:hypothetical protein